MAARQALNALSNFALKLPCCSTHRMSWRLPASRRRLVSSHPMRCPNCYKTLAVSRGQTGVEMGRSAGQAGCRLARYENRSTGGSDFDLRLI